MKKVFTPRKVFVSIWAQMSKKNRIDTSGGNEFATNPFDALNLSNLPQNPRTEKEATPTPAPSQKKGRVCVRREKSGRGGKTVTVIYDFEHTPSAQACEDLLKSLKNNLGCGGTRKDNQLELQGDRCTDVCEFLNKQGFRAVRSGG